MSIEIRMQQFNVLITNAGDTDYYIGLKVPLFTVTLSLLYYAKIMYDVGACFCSAKLGDIIFGKDS